MDKKKTICIVACVVMAMGISKKKKRRMWQKNWLANREKYYHMSLLRELRDNNPDDFKNYLRMDASTFDELLNLMKPHLSKQDTAMRRSIPADERLIATLRFLATGRSYEDLKFTTGISAQALGRIIPETCKTLYEVLQKDYLKVSIIYLHICIYYVFIMNLLCFTILKNLENLLTVLRCVGTRVLPHFQMMA